MLRMEVEPTQDNNPVMDNNMTAWEAAVRVLWAFTSYIIALSL